MAKASEALDATKSTQQFVDAAEARRARDGIATGGSAPGCSVYADEARADVSALRRQHADTLAAISQLEAKEQDRRNQPLLMWRTSPLLGLLRCRVFTTRRPRGR